MQKQFGVAFCTEQQTINITSDKPLPRSPILNKISYHPIPKSTRKQTLECKPLRAQAHTEGTLRQHLIHRSSVNRPYPQKKRCKVSHHFVASLALSPFLILSFPQLALEEPLQCSFFHFFTFFIFLRTLCWHFPIFHIFFTFPISPVPPLQTLFFNFFFFQGVAQKPRYSYL